ncbi:MAG TPA: chromosome segregation protein SMC [Acidimicrobiia bacterium]|nr:chromosome segregation protein SMC [Acidimicrobiia bacterium]
MYLKSLKVAGFKSFADRTTLEFRPGVTVVVGPNGAGKSNLVDALSWVLGTQSTRSLRTPKMEDVIFAGTATRPSLGKAETTLVIDNEERLIDLDLDEVSITRRLYRDGSSDYELNGVGCRLLDIQDLLSDSGVGRHQHVIIGQGEIGRVLNASAEEHRAVIEEAAGILKHRRRKERSERRLERTDEDMVRLQDLLGELNRQMRPLRRQARAAERYESLKAEVTALRLYLGGQNLARLDRELTMATSEKSTLAEGAEVDQRRVRELSQRLGELTESAATVGAELDRDTSAAAMLETTSERLRRIASVAQERGRAVSGRREAAVERRGDLSEESASIDDELVAIESERRRAETLASSAEAAFRRLEDEEQAIATQNSLSPEGALAAVRGELSALDSSLSRDRRELEKVTHRIDVLGSQVEEEQREIDRINTEIQSMDSEIGGLQKTYETASSQRMRAQAAWSEAEQSLEGARIELASAEARVEAISASLQGRFDAGARRAVEAAPGTLGSLTSQLDIPEGLEVAVSTALGEWADAVAFGDADTVKAAVELVKGTGGGSVSVVSAVSEVASPASEVAQSLGLEALVDRLGRSCHRGLATRLLGDVVLVEGWSAGWSLISKHPALRAVTPEGDLISVSGVRIADPGGVGSAMLEAAEVAAEQASIDLARAASIHTAAKRDFEKSRATERSALEALEHAESALAGHSEAMKRLQTSVRGLEEERTRLDERRTSLDEAIAASAAQGDVLRSRLAALEGEEAERLAMWEEMEASRARLAADRESARSKWQEAAAALGAVVERQRLLEDRRRRIDTELTRLDLGNVAETDPARLQRVGDYARRALATLETRIEQLRERQAGLREQNDLVKSDLTAVRSEHEERRERIARARTRISELDIRLTELRLGKESVVETIRRDADAEVEEAMGAPRPDLAEDTDLEDLMENLVTQLRRLGPINPLAAQEYRELEERHTFLSEQMADVESSRADLRKVISALEAEIQNRFDAAFSEVAEAYQKYFEVLFPGGRGQIRLVDHDDPRSGVSIDAQPLGKKVSQMTLLSGGERSLAALAFLFAVFEARPSPFYVLDEVEAALDDANLRRFLRIVDEFRRRAQLIIVTHQQQTMEAADVLYGVTMEPGGSSQAIRKDMREAVAADTMA